VQQPHPPVWVPVTVSKETIDWAAKENIPITPGAIGSLEVRQDMIRYYARALAQHGHELTPGHLVCAANVHIADSREEAIRTAGPYMLYFFRTLFSHGNIYQVGRQQQSGYISQTNLDWLAPERREGFLKALQGFRSITMEDIERNDRLCWGSPDDVAESIIGLADALGAGTINLMFNQGAMPHSMYMAQVERFGREVLPRIQAHEVRTTIDY
jgi:alkanesulfonate monooxygenase SsuD/methylene tetrahydromethanopterin reductase-like flavin-dependent oxidoreductase (luciferase family)